MKIVRYGAALVLTFVLFAAAAGSGLALTFKTGDSIVIGPGEVIEGDLFVSGDFISIEGTVRGDLFAAGEEVRLSGQVSEDALIAGGEVFVGGSIGQGLKAAARELTVAGDIAQDCFLAGSRVTLTPEASVGEDILFGAETLQVEASVDGYIMGGARRVIVNSTIGGSAFLGVRDLDLDKRTLIQGTLRYHSGREASIESGARVAGEIKRSVPEVRFKPENLVRGLLVAGFVGKLMTFITGIVIGLVLILIMGRWMVSVTDIIKARTGASAGWGALAVFAAPLGILLAFSTIVGAAVGVVVMLLYLLGLIFAQLLVGLLIGRLILEKHTDLHRPGQLFLVFLLGFFILNLGRFIPFAGGGVVLVAALFGMGALILFWAGRRGEAA
jgi:cytoskeletal protein CcmA (bactofilin family)